MKRDIFIISVYCLIAEIMQVIEKSRKFRSRVSAPKLTDADVITRDSIYAEILSQNFVRSF